MFPTENAISGENGGGGNRTRVTSQPESAVQQQVLRKKKDTWVYFIQAGGKAAPIKIGIAADPKTRLRMLQVGNHRELSIVSATLYSYEVARRIERLLHSRLWQDCLGREWFRPTVDVLKAARDPRGFVADGLEAQDRNAHVFDEVGS